MHVKTVASGSPAGTGLTAVLVLAVVTVAAGPATLCIMRMILKTRSLLAIGVAVLLLTTSCSSDGSDDTADGVKIVATTTMLGDIARTIVGDDGSVEVLFSVGASPHDFHPSSAQVTAIYAADLVLANGLHLEEGLSDVLDAAKADGVNVIEVAELLDPLMFGDRQPCFSDKDEGHHDDDDDEVYDHGECDPHVWFDPDRNATTAELVAESLRSLDPSVAWADRAATYADDLADADATIVEVLADIPTEDRLLVTNHDSLGYFADRYGFEVVGTVIPGGSSFSEPSSADLASLVSVINETGVSAIFAETSQATVLADAIADEVDHDVAVVSLYTGSVGEDGSGAETLIGMLLTNAERIAIGLS